MDFELLPWAIVSILGIVLAGIGYVNCNLTFGGLIWGIKINATPAQTAFTRKNKLITIVGFALNAISAPGTFMFLLGLLFDGGILIAAIYAVAWFGLAMMIPKKVAHKSRVSDLLLKENNAAKLGELPFVQAVEAKMRDAQQFVVSYEGIALVNDKNYCYAVERYEDYRMGALTEAKEVALIGMYFVQKYSSQYEYNVDIERIPGTPGQTVTFVGSGGINFGYVKGEKSQAIFRSYIFTRK